MAIPNVLHARRCSLTTRRRSIGRKPISPAIWLRKGYLLLDHVFLSDIQGPGIGIITGGDYTRSNVPIGYWGLVSNSVFVGDNATDANTYALEQGPPCNG